MRRRFRSRKMRLGTVIDATKNIVQFDALAIASGSVWVVPIALGVAPASIDELSTTKTHYVEEGAKVFRFNIDSRAYATTAGATGAEKIIMCIRKNENGSLATPTAVEMGALGAVKWKNRIFWASQAIAGVSGGFPMSWPSFRVPKGFDTMRLSDVWELCLYNASATTSNFCGMVNYKYYK